MIIAQLTIIPIGEGNSVSKYVKTVIKSLEESGVKFQSNAMSTVIEAEDLKTLFEVVGKAHDAVLKMGAKRVITELNIDDRRDKEATIESKLEAIK